MKRGTIISIVALLAIAGCLVLATAGCGGSASPTPTATVTVTATPSATASPSPTASGSVQTKTQLVVACASGSRLNAVSAISSSGQVKQLVPPSGAAIRDLAWSPDGRRLAYLQQASSQSEAAFLRIYDADSGTVSTVDFPSLGTGSKAPIQAVLGLSWVGATQLLAANATTSATYRTNGLLWLCDVTAAPGTEKSVKDVGGRAVKGAFPSAATDATLVAFVSYGHKASNSIPEKLQAYNADTLSVKTVATASQVADIDGDPFQYPLISPDGSLIAAAQTGSDPGFGVTVYPVDGSAPIKGGHYVWPTPMSWSFDGRLAFAGAPGNADWQASTVWVWKPGSGKPAKIIAPTKYPITSLAWSPKASQIAYAVGRDNGLTSDLWVVGADGGNPHLLLAKAGWPAWAQAPISFP